MIKIPQLGSLAAVLASPLFLIALAGMLYTLPEIDVENVIDASSAEDMRKAASAFFIIALAILIAGMVGLMKK